MKIFVAALILSLALIASGLAYLYSWLPNPKEISGCLTTKMYRVDLCPTSKNYVPLRRISPYLVKTIILTEDSNFYNHKGFDWNAIEKNAIEGWEKGSFSKGGSTITQQLAKNMFLNKDRTFIRKGLEAIITDRIESTLSKKEILEKYLNVIEFGKGIYGIKAAANYYFKKPASDLDVVESAFLAMVLPNPIKYSHSFYQKELTPFAKSRMNRIVDDMYRYHRINDLEYEIAITKLQHFLNPAPPPPEDFEIDTTSLEEDLDQLELEQKEMTPTIDEEESL